MNDAQKLEAMKEELIGVFKKAHLLVSIHEKICERAIECARHRLNDNTVRIVMSSYLRKVTSLDYQECDDLGHELVKVITRYRDLLGREDE